MARKKSATKPISKPGAKRSGAPDPLRADASLLLAVVGSFGGELQLGVGLVQQVPGLLRVTYPQISQITQIGSLSICEICEICGSTYIRLSLCALWLIPLEPATARNHAQPFIVPPISPI